jgi:hypothetical protein
MQRDAASMSMSASGGAARALRFACPIFLCLSIPSAGKLKAKCGGQAPRPVSVCMNTFALCVCFLLFQLSGLDSGADKAIRTLNIFFFGFVTKTSHETCWLCDQEDETSVHLLVVCPFVKEIWWGVRTALNCQCNFSQQIRSLMRWWTRIRNLQQRHKRKGINSLFMLVIWSVWKERNARLFNGSSTAAPHLVQHNLRERDLWILAGARELGRLSSE